MALPGEAAAGVEYPSVAGESPGRFAYSVEGGFPGVSSGGEVLYRGLRNADGWESTQYSPSHADSKESGNARFAVLGLSPDLDCGVVGSKYPLTSDPIARLTSEAGVASLYRRNPDGSYALITDRAPEDLSSVGRVESEFQLMGVSRDCQRVAFATIHHYVGTAGTGDWKYYEWDHGALRYVGWVPNGSTETAGDAVAGNGFISTTSANRYNAVSEDGSRMFFTATRLVGNNPGEAGKVGVFARIGGAVTLDVSLSQTGTAAGDAVYQGATPDGSRVYFTANAGLTPETSSEGRDLYECRIVEGSGGEPECELTDLSVDHDTGGASAGASTGNAIGALIGVADDGSHAYFVARGQLVEGEGRSFAQNADGNTLSIYAYESATEDVSFIGSVPDSAGEVAAITVGAQILRTSRVSPDGRFMVFESAVGLTGSSTIGNAAYLFDSEAETEPLVCVSCRPDGQPRGGGLGGETLLRPNGRKFSAPPRSLVVRDGEPLVFFEARDNLDGSSVEGEDVLYLWTHGQVFKIAEELPGVTPTDNFAGTLRFGDASLDGTDIYFFASDPLNWENPEARMSAWDARVGGGFSPPTGTVDCVPTSEGSCQGASMTAPSIAPVGSASLNGSGNVVVKPKAKKKHSKSGKGKKKKGKNHKKGKRTRHATDNRRAGK